MAVIFHSDIEYSPLVHIITFYIEYSPLAYMYYYLLWLLC